MPLRTKGIFSSNTIVTQQRFSVTPAIRMRDGMHTIWTRLGMGVSLQTVLSSGSCVMWTFSCFIRGKAGGGILFRRRCRGYRVMIEYLNEFHILGRKFVLVKRIHFPDPFLLKLKSSTLPPNLCRIIAIHGPVPQTL